MFGTKNRLAVFGAVIAIFVIGALIGALIWQLEAGASRPEPPSDPLEQTHLSFIDDAGRTITLEGPAERVVAGASFAVELLMALDHPPVLRPDAPEQKVHPETARSIPSFPVQHGAGPDVEAIAVARPDLVILHVNFAPFAENIQQTLGIPVALFEVSSIDDVSTKLELFGRMTGKAERGALKAASLRKQINELIKENRDPRPRVLALFGTPEAFYAYRETSYLGSMLAELGAENLAANEQALGDMRSIAPLNLEQAVGRSPQVILVVPHGPRDLVLSYLSEHPAWSQIEAVRSGQVHVLDEALFSSNPGPRAPQALRQLAQLLQTDPE